MPTSVYVVLAILVWAGSGVAAAALLLHRRGHRSWLWYLLAAALGLLFIPIAMERGRTDTRRIAATDGASAGDGGRGVTVLVGMDRSADAERAVEEAVRVFGDARPRMVLVSVVDQDAADPGDAEAVLDNRTWLTEYAQRLGDRVPTPATEVVTGPPGKALLEIADAHDADVIVVGRRGTGLSKRLLGGVADHLVRQSARPVLLTATGRG